MLANKILKKIITKYFFRILLFFVFYHGLIRPLQIIITDKFVKPLIEEEIVDKKYYSLAVNKHHLRITYKSEKNSSLFFSIPFGQIYFFLLFFLWFKPKNLIIAMSIYNLSLVLSYTFAIALFINGYFYFGDLVTLNERFYRSIYVLIFLIRIIRPKQFNLIFDKEKI